MSKLAPRGFRHFVRYSAKARESFSTKASDSRKDQQRYDTIGPADPISNLRPIVFAKLANETYLEKKYRELREDTQRWNQEFWSRHNINFAKARKEFQEKQEAQGKTTLSTDDMSLFYKEFLDRNWQSHLDYNIAWYKRNVKILLLEIAVKISRLRLIFK